MRDIFTVGIPASITNLMQSFMVMMTNHFLLAYGTDKIAAMGIALKSNMITALILVGFAFGGQPVGNALGTFLLSVCRQGVLYSAFLFLLSNLFGYHGVLLSQACADLATAVMEVCIIRNLFKK